MKFDPMTGEPITSGEPETEEMHFDPMTGKSITSVEPETEEMHFDPMTGKPITNAELETEEMHFDPMTGEPITSGEPKSEEMHFDPMTGKPITSGEPETEEMCFDPMTGKPITSGKSETEEMRFDPMTGKPITSESTFVNKKNNKKFKLFGQICAAIAGVVLVVMVLTNIFMPNSTRVYKAVLKTFDDVPYVVRDLKPLLKIASSGKFTVGVSVNYDGDIITCDLMKSGKEKQAVLRYDGEDLHDFTAAAGINAKEVNIYVPTLSKKLYTYNYTKNNDGFLMDLLGNEMDTLNDFCKSFYSEDNTAEALIKDIRKIFVKEVQKQKFTKIESETYEINGKSVKCKGYQVKITDKFVKSFCKSLKPKLTSKYADYIKGMLGEGDIDIGDFLDAVIDEADDFEDIEVSFYISGGRLAAVLFETDNEEWEIAFKGGNYRIQNMTLTQKTKWSTNTLKLKGSVENHVEKIKISENGNTYVNLKYDYKSGALDLDMEGLRVEGNLTSSSSKVVFNMDNIGISGLGSLADSEVMIYAKKEAKFVKTKGDKFDIGNADREDIYDELEDMTDALEDVDFGNLGKVIYNIF